MEIFGGLETKRFTKNLYFYTETLQVHKFESSLICKFLIKLCVIVIINSDFNEIIRMSTPVFTLSPTCTSSILRDVPLSRLIMAPCWEASYCCNCSKYYTFCYCTFCCCTTYLCNWTTSKCYFSSCFHCLYRKIDKTNLITIRKFLTIEQ